MLKELEPLVRRPNYYTVAFEFDDVYGKTYVSCIIRDEHYYRKPKIQVRSLALSEAEALAKAVDLLNKVKDLGEFQWPDLDKQKYDKGYYREIVKDNIEVEYKRIRNEFYVTDINLKDGSYYILDEPFEVPKQYEFLETLPNGDELYEWNNMGHLCGGSGKAIVRNGMVIKKKTEWIS